MKVSLSCSSSSKEYSSISSICSSSTFSFFSTSLTVPFLTSIFCVRFFLVVRSVKCFLYSSLKFSKKINFLFLIFFIKILFNIDIAFSIIELILIFFGCFCSLFKSEKFFFDVLFIYVIISLGLF